MKYLIIGTGGVGCAVGGFLVSKGNDVTFISRGKTLEVLRNDGLKIKSGLKGDLYMPNIKVFSSEEYEDKADVIFVCVKDYSLDSVIRVIRKASHKNSVVIPLLNGYGVGERISKSLDTAFVADGCVYISAFIEVPGSIIQLGSLFRLVLGARKGIDLDSVVLNNIKNTLIDCGIDAILSNNIESEIFKKFSVVSSCAACGAYYDITAGQIQEEEKYKQTYKELSIEMREIAVKLNYKFDPDLVDINLKFLYSMDKNATSSLHKDIKAGKKTEIDSLIFSVVRLAEKLDVEVPTYKLIADHFKKLGYV